MRTQYKIFYKSFGLIFTILCFNTSTLASTLVYCTEGSLGSIHINSRFAIYSFRTEDSIKLDTVVDIAHGESSVSAENLDAINVQLTVEAHTDGSFIRENNISSVKINNIEQNISHLISTVVSINRYIEIKDSIVTLGSHEETEENTDQIDLVNKNGSAIWTAYDSCKLVEQYGMEK